MEDKLLSITVSLSEINVNDIIKIPRWPDVDSEAIYHGCLESEIMDILENGEEPAPSFNGEYDYSRILKEGGSVHEFLSPNYSLEFTQFDNDGILHLYYVSKG